MNKQVKKLLKFLPVKTKQTESENKDYKKGMNKNITTPLMDIIVKRLQGETPVHIAKFRAVQDKDRAFNLKIINEEFDFKDDLDLTMNSIISSLNYNLELTGKSDADKLDIVAKEIIKEQNVIRDIERKEDANEFAEIGSKNIHDENNKLNGLKVLKATIENKGKGSFA